MASYEYKYNPDADSLENMNESMKEDYKGTRAKMALDHQYALQKRAREVNGAKSPRPYQWRDR